MNRASFLIFLIVIFIKLSISAEVPWQAPECSKRLLLTPQAVTKSTEYSALAKIVLPDVAGGIIPASVRVFAVESNGKITKSVPAQFLSNKRELLITIHPKTAYAYIVYFNSGQSKAEIKTHVLPQGKSYFTKGINYKATIDGVHGHLSSLKLIKDRRSVETLKKGIYWLFQRAKNITIWQYKSKPQRIEVIEDGIVRKRIRVSYADPFASGNSLTTTYTFYPRHIEVEQYYKVNKTVYTEWVKFFCSLAGPGTMPGFKSGPGAYDLPLIISGKSKWQKGAWRDVSYARKFGLGAISLKGTLPVWNMDSCKPDEYETLYIEPFGKGTARPIKKDIHIRIAYIPHSPGANHANMIANFFSNAKFHISTIQDKGSPEVDTDGDSVSDLDEAKRGSDPLHVDTDLDGLPDNKDPNPLIASNMLIDTKESTMRKAVSTSKDLPDCRISTVGGVPALVINGKAIGPSCYSGPNDDAQWARLSKAGIRVFS